MKTHWFRYPLYVLAILLGVAWCILAGWEITLRSGKAAPKLNAWGFHDAAPDFPPTARPRVLLLGDSFVEGIATPIKRLIGPRLRDHLGANAAVVSLGTPGAGQATELDLLLEYGPRVRPQAVVLVFTPSNDVLNNSPELEPKQSKSFYVLRDGELERQAPVEKETTPSRLRVLEEIRRRREMLRQKRQLLEAGGGVPLDFLVYRQAQSPEWERAWETTFALLERIDRTAAEHGARLLVAVAAERQTVDSRVWEQMVRKYPPMREGRWEPQAPAQLVMEWCAAHDIAAVDMQPAFATGELKKWYLLDGHWSAAGHELAARTIAEALGELLRQDTP